MGGREAECEDKDGGRAERVLGRGLKKKTSFYPHVVDKRFTPPPLIHVNGFYNNIIKFKYYPHQLTPPPLPPLSTF